MPTLPPFQPVLPRLLFRPARLLPSEKLSFLPLPVPATEPPADPVDIGDEEAVDCFPLTGFKGVVAPIPVCVWRGRGGGGGS